jgi:hypothetical protein
VKSNCLDPKKGVSSFGYDEETGTAQIGRFLAQPKHVNYTLKGNMRKMSRVKSDTDGKAHHSPDVLPDDNETVIETTDDGTEVEDTGITRPFDPTLINVVTKQMSLDTLVKRIHEGEVDLSPGFQRAEVWKPKAKAQLIESLLIRIPLPAFYMDATDEDNWLVVDGLQRLSAIRDFVIDQTLKLQGLEFLAKFEGKIFPDLPRNYQRRIEETQVTVYLIEKGTPPEVKFNIFKRINTGGMPLSSQEIRHALNQGPVTDFLKQLAESEEFLMATDRGVNDKRMAARECVLRFFAFCLTPPDSYKEADFDAFLSKAMADLNSISETDRQILALRFRRAMKASYDIFRDAAFRKLGHLVRTPVNKALFEVYATTLDAQSDKHLELYSKTRESVRQRVKHLLQSDAKFLNAVSQGTGDVTKVKYRFSKFRAVVEEGLL